MKGIRIQGVIVALAMLFCLTGCIELTEEYTFNKDGSGHAKIAINASAMSGMIDGYGDAGLKESISLEALTQEETTRLRKIPGITNVKAEETAKYQYEYSYDFADEESLALAICADEEDCAAEVDQKKFSRKSSIAAFEMPGHDMASSESMAGMIEDYNYKIIYHFPKEPKSHKINDLCDLDIDGKTATLTFSMKEMLRGVDLNHRFKY